MVASQSLRQPSVPIHRDSTASKESSPRERHGGAKSAVFHGVALLRGSESRQVLAVLLRNGQLKVWMFCRELLNPFSVWVPADKTIHRENIYSTPPVITQGTVIGYGIAGRNRIGFEKRRPVNKRIICPGVRIGKVPRRVSTTGANKKSGIAQFIRESTKLARQPPLLLRLIGLNCVAEKLQCLIAPCPLIAGEGTNRSYCNPHSKESNRYRNEPSRLAHGLIISG